MADMFVGEIRQFAGNFAPAGWALCNGQLLSIAENEVLFTLIGTTYGGDGQQTFAVPDLQGRMPIHQGAGHSLGEPGGTEQVTLQTQQLPAHSHTAIASDTGGIATPGGNLWGTASSNAYSGGAATGTMNPQSIGAAGGNQPHDNMHPYVAVTWIISLYGIFPSQS